MLQVSGSHKTSIWIESFTVFNLVTDLDFVGEVLSPVEQRLQQLHTQGPGRVPPKVDVPLPTHTPTEGLLFPLFLVSVCMRVQGARVGCAGAQAGGNWRSPSSFIPQVWLVF